VADPGGARGLMPVHSAVWGLVGLVALVAVVLTLLAAVILRDQDY
jgi:hypothetical protein